MMPIDENYLTPGMKYLDPPNHEGIDLYPESFIKNSSRLELQKTIRLIANGECIFIGEGSGHHSGLMVLFSHIQPDGAKIISIYCNLDAVNDLRIGQRYPAGSSIGEIWAKGSSKGAYLHFAIAYGSTWETDLKNRSVPPLNCGPTWISKRYIDPIIYLEKRIK
jgi:murein DD-endopeptidase MepM/ murein hydrolase activator NlpD